MIQKNVNISYGALYALFLREHPRYKNCIEDYRPASGEYSMQLWLIDNTSLRVTWDPKEEVFSIVPMALSTTEDTLLRMIRVLARTTGMSHSDVIHKVQQYVLRLGGGD